MPTPQFILDLRQHIGHAPLWLSGITAFVQNDEGKVLMAQRADTHEWALIYGITEPGEEPADTARREVAEETEIDCVPDYLAGTTTDKKMLHYPNGDEALFINLIYVCHTVPGGRCTPTIGDHENIASGWFDLDHLPQPLAQSTVERLQVIQQFLQSDDHHAVFQWTRE
ncbi:MAG: NUDIX domain-containing protein [Aeriscardovia sp.]|nr:NUDIX domain-containing protein [Aeriscardovia sp.]